MVKNSKLDIPKQANLSPEQMSIAIPKLKRRIEELQQFDINSIQEIWEPQIESLENKINFTLVEIFGNDTEEYKQFHCCMLTDIPLSLDYVTPLNKIREGYKKAFERIISNLKIIIELFEEKINDLGITPSGRALKAFGELEIHPEILRATSKLFHDGSYSNAVEDACKVLDGLVKIRSGKDDLSGSKLMTTVFSPKNPILKFNELITETDASEQEGMMLLFHGAMLAIRNPRAHHIIEDDPEKALEYIAFLSLLAKSLDKAILA